MWRAFVVVIYLYELTMFVVSAELGPTFYGAIAILLGLAILSDDASARHRETMKAIKRAGRPSGIDPEVLDAARESARRPK
mgnify:CR=1 FL=1